MIKQLRRLIFGECDCQKSQPNKRSKYMPDRDIDTVDISGWAGPVPMSDKRPPKPPHNPHK